MMVSPIKAYTSLEGQIAYPAHLVSVLRSRIGILTAAIQKKVEKDQKLAFLKSGHSHHGGANWLPLKRTTIRIKTKAGAALPSKPLVRTGNMAQMQRVKVQLALMPNGMLRFNVRAWNDAPYSRFHQSGFVHNWSKRPVPARPPVQFTVQDLKWIMQELSPFVGPITPTGGMASPDITKFVVAGGAVGGGGAWVGPKPAQAGRMRIDSISSALSGWRMIWSHPGRIR